MFLHQQQCDGALPSSMMYTTSMRRIQLYIDENLDDALTAEAAQRGVSRSSLVRTAVRVSLAEVIGATSDPIDELIGWLDVDPDDDIDSVVYGLDE